MKRAALLLLGLVTLAPRAHAEDIDVVFINGINNTLEDVKKSTTKLRAIVTASANHPSSGKNFIVTNVYNPQGWFGEPAMFEDTEELFLLKTSEEYYGDDLALIRSPYNASVTIDQAAALRIVPYLDDMTPGNNSLESKMKINDYDMVATQLATRELAARLGGCRPTIVVAHSEGNLLANLAYAKAASDNPDQVQKRVRVINVANTSQYSISGLNMTHEGDLALFSHNVGLVALPQEGTNATRTTPRCPNDDLCDFTLASPTFSAPHTTPSDFAEHSFTFTYLSTTELPTALDTQGVAFTPGKLTFADRFEDLVYAAAGSFDPPAVPATPGRYTAFVSYATNLVPGDANDRPDIFVNFVNDAMMVETTRVSQTFVGGDPNGDSSSPSISADGRFVAFVSTATNLVPGDTNGVADVFVFDRDMVSTTRVSIASDGIQANGASREAVISADGRVIAFTSDASNLIDGDSNNKSDVFVHELDTHRTTRASLGTGGMQGSGNSQHASLSTDGCFVAFESVATWFGSVGGQVYLHDRGSLVTTLVSKRPFGPVGNSDASNASVSGDGTRVAFSSHATNLTPMTSSGHADVFVNDLTAKVLRTLSVDTSGMQANDDSGPPSISQDGLFVAFTSLATNLVPGDTNATADVFVRDVQYSMTERISLNADGTQDAFGSQGTPAISRDGRFVAFYSLNNKFVTDDMNNTRDVVVHDRTSGATRRASVKSDGTDSDNDCITPALSP